MLITESFLSSATIGSELGGESDESDWAPSTGTSETTVGSSYIARFSGVGTIGAAASNDSDDGSSASSLWSGTATESGSVNASYRLTTNGEIDSEETPSPSDSPTDSESESSSDSPLKWTFTGTQSDSQRMRFDSSRNATSPFESGNLSGSATQIVTSFFVGNSSNSSELVDSQWKQNAGLRFNESSVNYSSVLAATGTVNDDGFTGTQSLDASSGGMSSESVTTTFAPAESESTSGNTWSTTGERTNENSSSSLFTLQSAGTQPMSAGPASVLASVTISMTARTSGGSLQESELSGTSDTSSIAGEWKTTVDSSHDDSSNVTTYSATGSGIYSRSDEDGSVSGTGTVGNNATQRSGNESTRTFDPVAKTTTTETRVTSSSEITINQSFNGTGSYTNALGGGSLSGIIIESTQMVFGIGSNESTSTTTVTPTAGSTATPSTPTPTRTGTSTISMEIGSSYSRAGVGAFTGVGLTGIVSENGSFGTDAAFDMTSSLGANGWVIDSATKSNSSSSALFNTTTTIQILSGTSGEFFQYGTNEVTTNTNRSSNSNSSQQSLQGGTTWDGTITTQWSTLSLNDISRIGSGEYRGMRQGLPVTGSGSSNFTSVSLTSLSSMQIRDLSGALIGDSGSGTISTVQTSQWNSSGGGSITENFTGVPTTTSGPGYTTTATSSSSRTLTLSESKDGSSSYSDVTILASINGSLQNVSRQVDETSSANSSSDSSTTFEGTSKYVVSAFNDYSNYDLNVTSDWIDRRSGSSSSQQSSFNSLTTNYASGVTTSDSGSNSNFDSDSDVDATYTSEGTLTQSWLEWNEDNQDFEWHTYEEVSNSTSNWFAEDASLTNSSSTNDDTTSTGSSHGRTGDSFTSTTDRTTNGETETTTDSGSTERSYETNTEEEIDQSDSDGTYGPYSGPPISPSPPDPRTSPSAAPDDDDSNDDDSGNEETSSPGERLSERNVDAVIGDVSYGGTSGADVIDDSANRAIDAVSAGESPNVVSVDPNLPKFSESRHSSLEIAGAATMSFLTNFFSRKNASTGLDLVPVVSTIKSGVKFTAGYDFVAGEEANQVIAGIGFGASFLPSGKAAVKGSLNAVTKLDDIADAAKNLSKSAPSRVTGQALADMRKAFAAAKPQAWMDEAASNASKYTAAQLERMKKGLAPLGDDGFSMEIHHLVPLAEGGTNAMINFQFLTRTLHRLGPNYKINHPNLP